MVSKIKIGYQIYDVVEVECVNKFEPRKGEIDLYKRQIRIDREMTEHDKLETLIHEVIHGIDEFMGVSLEEAQVRKLGAGFAMVIMDNPKFIAP